jgi:hypothetical protein
MTRKDALALILRAYPGRKDARLEEIAIDALRDRQLQAASMRYEGWPFLRREALVRLDGGYRTGRISLTADSTAVELTDGGTWPSNVVGWILAPQGENQERYTVKTRTDDTNIVIDRPYIGATGTGIEYAVYDRRGYLPMDYLSGESLVIEAGVGKLGVVSLAYAKGGVPKSAGFGDAKFTFLTEPTKTAAYSTGSVTLTGGSATVVLATGTWPTWCKHHFLRFANEPVWYRILTRDSDTNVTLDRPYGGENTGASQTYELDPAGCYQFEYEFPRLNRFTVRVVYMRVPEELVNDNDVLEGPDPYARAICAMASADVLSSLPGEEVQEYQGTIQSLLNRGTKLLEAMTEG